MFTFFIPNSPTKFNPYSNIVEMFKGLIIVERRLLSGNKIVTLQAAYSRNSSNSKSPYKIVQARIKSEFLN